MFSPSVFSFLSRLHYLVFFFVFLSFLPCAFCFISLLGLASSVLLSSSSLVRSTLFSFPILFVVCFIHFLFFIFVSFFFCIVAAVFSFSRYNTLYISYQSPYIFFVLFLSSSSFSSVCFSFPSSLSLSCLLCLSSFVFVFFVFLVFFGNSTRHSLSFICNLKKMLLI